MIRAAAAALTLLTVTPGAHAAGLGRLTVLSTLGQPFRGEVDLVSLKKEEVASLVARLGSPDAFRQADLPYTAYVSNLRLSLEKRPNGDPYIKVSAPQALNEPFIDFMVELSWNSGRLVRAYTALVDPPIVKDGEADPGAEVKPSAAPDSLQAQPVPQAESGQVAAPPAETGKKPKAGSKAARPEPKAAATAEPGSDAAPAPASGGSPAEYGPVKRGQTLAQIARETRPADATLEQMLVLLYRNNPDAFEGKNMNRLKAGQVLRVPTAADLSGLSPQDALKEFRVQSSNWKAYRSRLADAAESTMPADEPAGRTAGGKITTKVEEKTPPAQDASKDILKLSKGETPKSGAPAPVSDTKTQERIRTLEEEIAAKGRAVGDANQRIAQLEKQIKDMQALLEMKSKGMADLQKPVEKAPEKPAAPPPPPPPVMPEPPKAEVPAPLPAPGEPPKGEPLPAPPAPEASAPPTDKPVEPPAAEAPPPPPPKPKFVPPPPPPPPSLVDQLLDNPLILGAGALVVAALGGLGFSAWKRKKAGAAGAGRKALDESMEPLESAEDTFGPAGFAAAAGAATATAASSVQASTGALSDESDALAEAEVFLIYGRDSQAEERLKEAIAANPTRHELHAKLLEIYAKRGDANAFERVATDLQKGTGGEGDLWEKAVQLGYQIDATNPRYASGRVDEDTVDKTVPGSDDESTMQMPAFDAGPRDDLDFNLDFEATSAGSTTDIDLGQLGQDLERSGTTTTDIDLGLLGGATEPDDVFDPSKTITRVDSGDPLAQTSEMAAFDPTSTIAPTDAADLPTLPGLSLAAQGQRSATGGLDFDIGDTESTIGGTRRVPVVNVDSTLDDVSFDLDTLKLDSSPLEETSPGVMLPKSLPESDLESTRPGVIGATDLDLSGISLDLGDSPTVMPTGGAKDEKWYDVQTKFDLAKAYQEMGDKEGAREILEEVITEGDAEQQSAARELLDALGS